MSKNPRELKATKTRRTRKPLVYELLAGIGWLVPPRPRGRSLHSYETAMDLNHELGNREWFAEANRDPLEFHERMIRHLLQTRVRYEDDWPPGLRKTVLDQLAVLDLAKTLHGHHWNVAEGAYRPGWDFGRIMKEARAAFCTRFGTPPRPLPVALVHELQADVEDEWGTETSIQIGGVDYALGEKRQRLAHVEQLRQELGERFIANTTATKRPMQAGATVRDWQRKMRQRARNRAM